jgi:hypothetical protein
MGSTIQVNGSGSVNTDFMRVAGFPTLNFDASSTSAWGHVRMRVAIALDNTGSMRNDGKMPALQNAVAGTGGLIDQLSALAKNNGDIYISVVPFAKDVNFGQDATGASNVSQPWIDWTLWDNGQWHLKQYQVRDAEQLYIQPQHLDEKRPQPLDRLFHRPHPRLRYHEHYADDHGPADSVPGRGICLGK